MSRIITVHRLDGATVTYRRPSYLDIERNYRETDATAFDRIERGAVSGGVALAWPVVAIEPAGAPKVSRLMTGARANA